ncbi:polyprenyl synthetase family protein [Streptococcus minor]|uniref:polyprenyl synthetase family protein n=1 Tax=Streptococcus minor TaxID=229549 RepID=UPI0003661636|nr:polyprenyl synthetase family protein [Streptococcus minor]
MVHPIWNDFPAVQQGLVEVKKIIKEELRLAHPQVKYKIIEYLDAPGKYIRAGLSLLLAQAVEGEISKSKLYFAAGIEVLHLATLIHDDVIDGAESRRGIIAMQQTFSNRIAIYAGDYLLAYSGRLIATGQELMGEPELEKTSPVNQRILERILAGELAQLINQNKSDMTMKDYLKQIKGKTAFLFALACQLGAYTLPTNHQNMQAAFRAGQAIGMAFQLSDDLLDFQLTQEDIGKPALQDVQNGIYTAPLLLAMRQDTSLAKLVHSKANQVWTQEELNLLQEKLENSQAYAFTQNLIASYIEKSEDFLARIRLKKDLHIAPFLDKMMARNY